MKFSYICELPSMLLVLATLLHHHLTKVNTFTTNNEDDDNTDNIFSTTKNISLLLKESSTELERLMEETTITSEGMVAQEESSSNNNTIMANEKEPYWFADALKDIAYYLRAHKFNEYDRRYETVPERAKREYYKYFPRPPLRSLHWEVRKYCEESFMGCIDYLRHKIEQTGLRRADDTSIVLQEQNWTETSNSEQIKLVEEECQKMRKTDDILANPFAGPLERFQWRTTASYYMCWYTMQETPQLEHIHEPCDNFAYCLDPTFGPNNHDIRAEDYTRFSCALYSFCPNPCCPMRYLNESSSCWNSHENPCYADHAVEDRECLVNRTENIEFSNIVLNRWNVTCSCPLPGYEWNSLYGMCIDVDECATNAHNCDTNLEACINLPGSFQCACKWGYAWNPEKQQCTTSPPLDLIKLQIHNSDNNTADEGQRMAQSIVKRIYRYFVRSSGVAMTVPYSSILFIQFFFFL